MHEFSKMHFIKNFILDLVLKRAILSIFEPITTKQYTHSEILIAILHSVFRIYFLISSW